MEHELGFPLIKPTRGGADGGNTVLTLEAKIIIQLSKNFTPNMISYPTGIRKLS